MSSPPRLGHRLSRDRESIVVTFGEEGDTQYYGVFAPSEILAFAATLQRQAAAIMQLRLETTH